MIMLPIKQYAVVAKAFHKKGIKSKQLQRQLHESNGVLLLNGKTINVSQNKLVAELEKLEEKPQWTRVSIIGVRQSVLEREYARLLAENKYI